MNQPVILIDVLNLAYRTHYAFPHLHDGKGAHTGVIYGVLKTIHDLRTTVSNKIIMVWDHGVPVLGADRPRNWREEVVPSYKGTRKRDESFQVVIPQLAQVAHLVKLLGYSSISVMGLEADDIIGILSHNVFPEVLIFSTDRDFYQLLRDGSVGILVPKKDKKQFRRIQQPDVEREHGISVTRWAEYLALGGDSSDNIKPLRGLGPKTAIKIIMSGADLRKRLSFQQQPPAMQSAFPKLEPVWEDILKSYYAAQIPLTWTDPRIQPCLTAAGYNAYTFAALNAAQSWPSEQAKETCKKKFIQLLNTMRMNSLYDACSTYFDTEREPLCNPAKTTPAPKRNTLI